MITLLATILSAAPAHLIAVHGPSSGSMVKKLTVAGAKTLDASPLREYLFRAGLMQDFEAFKAAPPPGWAPAPVNVWTEGLAHCRSLANECGSAFAFSLLGRFNSVVIVWSRTML